MTETYQNRTVTAFFDERDDAEDAVRELRTIGVPKSSIRLLGGDRPEGKYEEKGFWENLKSFFFPEDDREIYGEGLRRGGYLVTVTGLDPDLLDQALDILDAEGTVDLEQRSETWRSEGWTGVQGSSAAELVSPRHPAQDQNLTRGAGLFKLARTARKTPTTR